MESTASGARSGGPAPANTLGNRPLATSTGIYQSCVALRERLWCVPGFGEAFLEPVSPGMQPQYDPVTQLWQCFRLGTPLCVLFNALGPEKTRPLSLGVEVNLSSANACKALVMRFLIALKEQLGWDAEDTFTVMQLYVNDTNGFVRVVRTVDRLLDVLSANGKLLAAPEKALRAGGPAAGGAGDDERMRVVTELLETERKYVHDLEVLQQYANALAYHEILPTDTIYMLFGNLNQLVDVQRRFLICVEENALRAPEEQQFGHIFRSMERDFSVYELFCANYAQALDVISRESQHLLRLRGMPGTADCYLEPAYELPAFLIKPVQRICKYPLLLEQLLKRTPADAPKRDELVEALTVIRRITDKVNETSRVQSNMEVVRNLTARVEDWKGHSLPSFGALLLHDVFVVSKDESEREFHVYLFERILLCCKDASVPQGQQQRSRSRGALLRPRQGSFSSTLPTRREGGPLQLKGRIFISNITRIQVHSRAAAPYTTTGSYVLQIWWRGESEQESFCIKCRNEETLRMWHTTLQRLLDEYALRRQLAINARSKLPPMSFQNARTPTAFMQVTTPVVPTPLDLPLGRSSISDESGGTERKSSEVDPTIRRPSAVSASAIAGARLRHLQRPHAPTRSMSAAASGSVTPNSLDLDLAALSLAQSVPGLHHQRQLSPHSATPMKPTLSDSALRGEVPTLPHIPALQPMSPTMPGSPELTGWNPYFPAMTPAVSTPVTDTTPDFPGSSPLETGQNSPVAARIRHGDTAFYCAIPAATTFAALVEMVHTQIDMHGAGLDSAASLSPQSLSFGAHLYYIDDDGDRVMMYDNEDLSIAMDLARAAQTPIELIVP
ncbi:Guanine nucleotide exchange factor for Cdc42p [Malassezia cuniculi]|uniref:Guanine nucleotide exchange factor for Cdc42p n=1 Tax=Malassezia cuniculi TaxID=948313 RepID=A0AAF0J6X2_9BASI|nr:Guanine nucleotide exchange factor for Cdc42p [Malassezia cuniculi]